MSCRLHEVASKPKKTDSLEITPLLRVDADNATTAVVEEDSSDDLHSTMLPKRPPIIYSSPKAFVKSFGERWRSVWTPRFALALLCGQIVSLCITCTNVATTELVKRNWPLSTTQTFFLFVFLIQLVSIKSRTVQAHFVLLVTFHCSLSTLLIQSTSVSTINPINCIHR
jgi:hypothetical protein